MIGTLAVEGWAVTFGIIIIITKNQYKAPEHVHKVTTRAPFRVLRGAAASSVPTSYYST